MPKISEKFDRGHPLRGRHFGAPVGGDPGRISRPPNASGVGQNRRLSTNNRLYLENGTRQTHGFY